MPASCARCHTPLPPGAAPRRAERALCEGCVAYFERIRSGLSLSDYLDMFEHPVLVSDGDGNVVAANSAMASLGGRAVSAVAGERLGDATGCSRSRLPGGCGKSLHCRDCTIRRMVTEVSRTRLARRRVPAYLQTEEGRTELCITVRPGAGELVEVVLEDAPPLDG